LGGEKKTPTLKLYPEISKKYTSDYDELSFRVGRIDEKKSFVVKDIKDFYEKLVAEDEYQITPNKSIFFDEESLNEKDEELIRFAYNEKIEEDYVRGYSRIESKALAMSPSRYDGLFDRAKTVKIDKNVYFKKDDEFEFLFECKRDDKRNGYHFLYSFPSRMIEGSERIYYFNRNDFSMCVSSVTDTKRRLIRKLEKYCAYPGERQDIFISDANKHELSDLIEKIEKLGMKVKGKPELSEDEEKKPEVSYYFDADRKNFFCKVGCKYGDEQYSIELNDFGVIKGQKNQRRNGYFEGKAIEPLRGMFVFDEETFVTERDTENAEMIFEKLLPRLKKSGNVMGTKSFQNARIRRRPEFSVGLSFNHDLLNIEVTSSDFSPEELSELLGSYTPQKRFYTLKTGKMLKFDDEDKTFEELFKTMNMIGATPEEFVKGKLDLPLYRTFYLESMLQEREGMTVSSDERIKSFIESFENLTEERLALPSGLNARLRPYQEEGYRWLASLANGNFGGILADEMGLGKTLQTITLLLAAKDDTISQVSSGKALIVTPAALLYNWQNELENFAPTLKALVINGTKKQRHDLLADVNDYDVVLTTYDQLKRDFEDYRELEFEYEIIDEAQNIKNSTTQASKAVKAINAKKRFALTGTPIENRLSELWSIFDYIMPGYLFSYREFREQFERPIVINEEKSLQKILVKMIAPFVLRRRKSQVLKELPEKIERPYYAEMSGKQAGLYQAMVNELKAELSQKSAEEFKQSRIEILSKLTRIRQLCCDPGLVYSDYNEESAKTAACMELIESALSGGHRIIIFSQFVSMLSVLEGKLRQKKIEFYKIVGETPKEDRFKMVEEFNQNDVPVFLISLKAGGTGLNLVGADVVIHCDPWWNEAAQNQATDRAHRIGQTKNVLVYKLIVKDTIEEKILKMQERKARLADDILSGKGMQSGIIDKDDLMMLL
ncbi:DEAD/DEAH box helicase, partial [Ligilactobacillus sp.]|uniref:DEAD/DEAH box helicase n=1 Tax=Ligilactobacillus sp. TaxID=2767921 RepID=UPI002FE39C7F